MRALHCMLALMLAVAVTGCERKEKPRLKIKRIERLPSSRPTKRPVRYEEQVKHDPNHVLGGEQGLDHVGVAVKDLAGARAAYTKLGFGNPQEGRLPNGIDNVNFYFGDTTYLELLTYYDRQKNPWVSSFVDKYRQGGMFLMLCVFTYTHTANFLRRKGFRVSDPLPGQIKVKGARAKPPGRRKAPTWLTFHLEGQTLPGNTTFIAYTRRLRRFMLTKLKDPRVRRKHFSHPNTVLGLRSSWIAVKDLAAARKAFESIGLAAGRQVRLPRLFAHGVEIIAGKGKLVLLTPDGPKSPLRAFLARRKEGGIVGLGFEVERLEQARAYIKEHAGLDLTPQEGPYGRSILVPADRAYGVYLSLFQGKRAPQ